VTRPPRSPGPEPHPALVLLHGRGADELDLLALADELDPRLFVVSVRAPLPLPPGYAWYHLLDLGNPEPTSFVRSLDLLALYLQELSLVYPIDPSRVFTLGFSQGAMMAGSLGMTHPEATAGTVILSGYLPLGINLSVDEAKLANRPVFQAHGTQDPIISVQLARQARDFLRRVGADLTYREYPIAHFIDPQELAEAADWLGKRVKGNA
jgi:phospholipase/carboxylesterase